MSGSSCARTGCPTECSNASTTSSAIAAMPGTHSSTSPGKSCLLQDAHGLASVNQSEDLCKTADNHLAQWTKEKWGTKSGAESGKTGSVTFPSAREVT